MSVYFKYDINYRYYFPVIVSDRLFCGAEEDDFILNRYTIRRFCGVIIAEIKDDKCLKIAVTEGITDQIVFPKIDIINRKAALMSLHCMKPKYCWSIGYISTIPFAHTAYWDTVKCTPLFGQNNQT